MKPWATLGLSLALAVLAPARADFPDGFNHPEVDWLEFETDHFTFVYNAGLESTARLAARLAEEVHPSLCKALGVEPAERTTIVLSDFDDVGANNFTRRMEHVIYLSNPVLNQGRVDRETWLRHLLAHEYVHVLNGWAYRSYGRTVGELIEWSGMELQPQWFTEGLAEYLAGGGDQIPSYVLDAAREGELLHGAQLDIRETRFDVIQTAMVYQQGYAMVQALVRKFGPDILRRILEQYAHAPQFDIAFKLATGQFVEKFTRDVIDEIREQAGVVAQLAPGELLPARLPAALAARPSPDGKLVAVVGVDDWEQPVTGLWLMRPDGTGWRKIAGDLDLYDSWKLAWSPDSRYLVYTARVRIGTGAFRNALYCHDLQRDKTWKIDTGSARLLEPEFSPDGSRLAVVSYADERARIAVLNPETGELRNVTDGLATSCFSPTWSPDGSKLAFSIAEPTGVDIAVINLDGTGFTRLTNDPLPDQFPAWSPDGTRVAFTSYRAPGAAGEGGEAFSAVTAEAQALAGAGTGIYLVPATGGPIREVSQAVEGGLYYPAWSSDGRTILASWLRIRRADIVQLEVPATVAAGPSVTERVEAATAAAGPTAPGAEPTIGTPARRYDGLRRLRPFVLRPITGDDGLGDTFGARWTWSDPLQRHRAVLESQLGVTSDQVSYEFSYLDGSLPVQLGANAFRRVPPLRGERGALVAEVAQGAEFLAEWPVALTRDPYTRDKLIFGFEVADHEPFATAGGALRPPPRGAWICGPSVGWQRVQLLPGHGNQEIRIKLTRSDNAFGADLDFATFDALFARRMFMPDPRHTLTVGAALNWFDGEDFSRAEVDRTLLSGQLRYDVRLADQLFSQETWPYVHIGPVRLTGAYELRELLSGTSGGADLRDSLTLELTNEGYVSRHVVYLLRLGQRYHIGGNGKTDSYCGIEFSFRDLPF